MVNTYVLDTNVLLTSPNSLNAFAGEDVVLYIGTIEECDRHKKSPGELGFNARTINRMLSEYPDLAKGQKLENGGTLTVTFDTCKVVGLDDSVMDNRIIGAALYLKNKGKGVILVSQDANMLVKSQAIGLKSKRIEDIEKSDEGYKGFSDFEVDTELFNEFSAGHSLPMGGLQLSANEFVILHSKDNPEKTIIGRFDSNDEHVRPINTNLTAWGIHPRNAEQVCLFNLLLDPSIKLVTVQGLSGSGKTICALSAALEQVTETGRYKKLLISRAIASVGAEIGYLPGILSEKLQPWMMGFYDNLDQILQSSAKTQKTAGKNKREKITIDDLIEQDIVGIECMSYIRGRSINDSIIILDESQNTSVKELQALITRAGQNTKIILLGDTGQIDVRGLDSCNCGIATVTEKFKGQAIFGSITLQKGERSLLATLGSELL